MKRFVYANDGALVREEEDDEFTLENTSGWGRSVNLETGEARHWSSQYVLLHTDESGKHYQKRWKEAAE